MHTYTHTMCFADSKVLSGGILAEKEGTEALGSDHKSDTVFLIVFL